MRWFLHSNRFKARVLSEPSRQDGLLKHAEWDGWGLAGNDTTVYLVFDPSDQLATPSRTAAPGKYPGLPCEVARVNSLERYWYTVLFYTELTGIPAVSIDRIEVVGQFEFTDRTKC